MIVSICGQPRSGKSTLAQELQRRDVIQHIVEGESCRAISDPGYDAEGRELNVERASFVALYLERYIGLDVALCLVNPHREQRERLKRIGADVHEVYLRSSEVRGLEHYAAEDFERPETDFIEIDTDQFSVPESADLIEGFIDRD